MDKKELLNSLEEWKKYRKSQNHELQYYQLAEVINLVEQLDEPQKVKVSAFVAKWISKCRELSWILPDLLAPEAFESSFARTTEEWLRQNKQNYDILARAWLDGYEVEEEPKWVVKYKPGNLDNNWYFIGFCGGDRTLQPNCANRIDCDTVIKFKDRSKAEAVATLIDGTVEKV